MIGLKIDQAKALFFDRAKVTRAMSDATRRALSKAGAFVRTTAKGLIRSGKGVSKPGSPPKSHVGLLKKFLFFAYDERSRSVVIGPMLLTEKTGEAPSLLEYGGLAKRRRRNTDREFLYTYKARPYMGPALEKNVGKIPSTFQNSITAKGA